MSKIILLLIVLFIVLTLFRLFVQYWRIAVPVIIGMMLGNVFGAFVGLLVGLWLQQNRHQQRTTEHLTESETRTDTHSSFLTILPLVRLVAYYTNYGNQAWSSEKVRYVKNLFIQYCQNQQDIQILQQSLKEPFGSYPQLIDAVMRMSFHESARLDIFMMCATGLAFNGLSEQRFVQILLHLGESLRLNGMAVQSAIQQLRQQFYSYQQQQQADYSSSDALRQAYQLLGVADNAGVDEVKRAFKVKIMKYHPDRHPNASPAELEQLNQKTIALQNARDLILQSIS